MGRTYGLFPVFVPMHTGEDTRICKMLAGRIHGAVYFNAPCERGVRRVIRMAEFTVCMRLHAAVFSVLERVPPVALSDDFKLSSFLPPECAALLGASAKAGELASAARELIENRKEKQKLLGDFAEEQRRLAKEELLRLCGFLGI